MGEPLYAVCSITGYPRAASHPAGGAGTSPVQEAVSYLPYLGVFLPLGSADCSPVLVCSPWECVKGKVLSRRDAALTSPQGTHRTRDPLQDPP